MQAELQWNAYVPGEEDMRPWHFQRRSWRSTQDTTLKEQTRMTDSASAESSFGRSETRLRPGAAGKMLTIAQLIMKETMMQMEQANTAVEVAKRCFWSREQRAT